MKFFAISIPRSKKRHSYIKKHLKLRTRFDWEVLGVDGIELRKNSASWLHSEKLRDTEVGCSASHATACRRIVEQGHAAGFVVEDDAELPENIDDLINQVLPHLRQGEVIAFYNRTIEPANFSNLNAEQLDAGALVTPIEARFMRTTAAYLIEKSAAEAIADFNTPVQVVADDWARFYQTGVVKHLRLLHPIPVRIHPFPSTLAADRSGSFVAWLKRTLNALPLTSHLLARRRKSVLSERKDNIILVDQAPQLLR